MSTARKTIEESLLANGIELTYEQLLEIAREYAPKEFVNVTVEEDEETVILRILPELLVNYREHLMARRGMKQSFRNQGVTEQETNVEESVPIKANRNYKDSVFCLYFQDKERLIDLYNALKGVNYPLDTPININTLERVLYRGKYNDISFEIDGKFVVLVEHQSTINPNMPVRLLMYLGRIYEKLLGGNNVYSTDLIKLDAPEFYVVYAGREEMPEISEVRLSDAFKATTNSNSIELVAKVVNAWYADNKEILKHSRSLRDYSLFISKVQEYLDAGQSLEEAIHSAVRYCTEHDIMREFLLQNSSEVENMLFAEWNQETAIEVAKKEGREKGRAEGRAEGEEKVFETFNNLKNLVRERDFTVEEALFHLDIPEVKWPMYKEMLR